jgi:hypothetical protein
MSNSSGFNNAASTHDQDVFAFYPDERPCNGFQEALARYREIVPHLRLSGMKVKLSFYFLEIFTCQFMDII